jgi:hypothetical protein
MADCADYRRHELWCEHPAGPRWRWRTADGCQGTCCEACCYAPGGPAGWSDLTALTAVDADGLPLDPRVRTEVEQIIAMLRGGPA